MPNDVYSTKRQIVQALLRQVRVEAGLRQSDMAKRISQPQSYVSKYESGERRLDLLEIRQICGAVGMTLREFVDRLEKSLQ